MEGFGGFTEPAALPRAASLRGTACTRSAKNVRSAPGSGYTASNRGRGPYSSDDLQNAARRLLSPAQPWGVEFDVTTQNSTRAKSVAELVRDYGTVAESVRVDLTADFSYYDPESDTFTEAPTPLRRLDPRFDPAIDAWFRILAGPHYDALNAWCAASTMASAASST